MNTPKLVFWRLAIRIAIFNFLVCLAVCGAFYGLIDLAAARTHQLAGTYFYLVEVHQLAAWVETGRQLFWLRFVPVAILVFFLITLSTAWSVRRLAPDTGPPFVGASAKPHRKASTPAPSMRDEQTDAATRRDAEGKRLYLHLIAVLQKEGRLLDFFSEELNEFSDSQIGAAVRSIHGNCKKALEASIAPMAVLSQDEEEEIVVSADFDPNALKLVGNVTGRPPFKGIVRHRGWKARKLELPSFSGSVAPEIIAPAEVEVR